MYKPIMEVNVDDITSPADNVHPFYFHGIPNFRKPTDKLPVYRSAAWDHTTDDEKKRVISETGITHRIDLRSEMENTFSLIGQNQTTFPDTLALQLRLTDPLLRSSHPNRTSDVPVKLKQYLKETVKYNINFIDTNYRNHAVWKRLTCWQKCQVLFYLMTFQHEKVVKLVNSNIVAPRGLFGMYTDFIDFSQSSIATTLHLITSLLEEGYVVQWSCARGQDRTGIVTAFIKHCIGDSFENILEDYGHSEEGINDLPLEMKNRFKVPGLPDEFNHSPPENLERVWSYIEEHYTSIDDYLTHIGFDSSWRERLKRVVELNVNNHTV